MDAHFTAEELQKILEREFPQGFHPDIGVRIEHAAPGEARLRQTFADRLVRPGGTISGPVMMALADSALYVALLMRIGWVPLSVTTSLTVNFLRKPAARDLLADCRYLKIGKRLAVGEVLLRSDGEAEPVAHVTGTYAIPPAER